MFKNIFSIKTLSSFIILLVIVSCGDQNTSNEGKEGLSDEDRKEQISIIESLHHDAMNATTKEDAKKASEELLTTCLSFIEDFPRDPNCAEYMFMAAKAANGLKRYKESLVLLDRMTKVYSDYENLIEVYFLYAFTLDEDLNEKDEAKKAYTKLITKYPGEPLSKQAEVLMEQLYLSDEELIEQLMEDNKE